MALFSIDAMRDTCESQCFHFWNNWLESQNRFFKRIMGQAGIRHFETILLNKLAALGSSVQIFSGAATMEKGAEATLSMIATESKSEASKN